MNDGEAIDYFNKKLDTVNNGNWTGPPVVKNGKVRVLGLAMQKMLVKGPPVYYVGLEVDGRIKVYDLEYDVDGLLASCRKVARLKKVDPKKVGFSRINGASLLKACLDAGITSPKKVSAANFYDFPYEEGRQ